MPADAVLRDVWFGRVWRANACLVVHDGPERLVLHFPRGAPARLAVDASGREVRIPEPAGWILAERVGRREGLALFRPGARHSVWLFWNEDWSFAHWYINFEEPLRRTPLGFDFRDEKLDLVIDPTRAVHRKDEEELDEAAGRGLVDRAAVLAEAERVLADPPWPTGWEGWRPDPAWPVPALPPGWDRVDETSPPENGK